MRIYLHSHADKELSSARCSSHSQNGKELWVDSALRNKHPFQGRNNKVICFIPTLLLVIVPLPRHIFSQHSQQEVCKLALPSFEQLSHNKTHPRRFNCFYCVSQTLSSTSHTAFLRHQWRSCDSLEKSEGRTRADVFRIQSPHQRPERP